MALPGDTIRLIRRLGAVLRRPRLDDELAEEIEQHIALRTRALIDEGLDPRDAAFEARRRFGNATVIREETRDMRSFRPLDTLSQDVRFAVRLMRRSPVFTLAAVASLAIGIGSAAAVFSLADGLLLRTLPVRDPGSLVLFRWTSGPEYPFESLNGFGDHSATGNSSTSFSLDAFTRIREQLASDAEVFAFADLYTVNLSIDGRPETATGQVVSGNYFATLGIAPALGRLLGPGDDRPDAPPAVVISHELWQRRFGGDPRVVGRAAALNGLTYTIVGVLPAGFVSTLQVGQSSDVTIPLASYGAVARPGNDPADPNFWWVLLMARVKPGSSPERVQAAADLALKASVAVAKPEMRADARPAVRVEPGAWGQTDLRGGMRESIRIMAAVVLVVLLVACANVANLLLARGRARQHEIAIRTAIGAPRRRIIRQLLSEGLVLGLAASGLGLILAQWIAAALLPALASNLDTFTVRFTLDLRVVGFTCALGVAASVLFALVPALTTSRAGAGPALQERSRGVAGTARGFIAGGSLVVVQVALSLLLLSAAALLGWSAQRLLRVSPGFDPANLLTFSVNPSLNGYDDVRSRAFVSEALARLREVPGVLGASVTSSQLIANSSSVSVSRPEGTPPVDPGSPEGRELAQKQRTWRLTVDDTFFETYRIPLLKGRTFPPAISPEAPPVAVINESLALQLFGTTDVLGRRFVFGLRPGGKPIEIIGVAADAHYTSLRQGPPPTAYIPYQQSPFYRVTFAVRTAGEPSTATPAVRETMRRIDPALPLFAVRTQEEQIRRSLDRERLFARLAVLLGVVTLALSGIGLYGVLAYSVTGRTREIGVRMALGAARGQVRWMVLRQSLLLVAIGLALGVPGAAMSAGLLESLLFGLEPYDPRALGGAAAIMTGVALLAAFVPARRASRIDPLIALRAE